MRTRVQGWLLSSLLAVGCAHAPAQRVETPPPPVKQRVKLAVLPVDADQYPQIASSLNVALHAVRIKGVDDYLLSKVTLEVVQLSIECVQPTSECYAAVGKSLTVDKLLLGHIVAMGKKKRDRSVRVTITLFDVGAGEVVNVVDHVYKTPELASQGASELVAEAIGEPPRMFGPDEDKPATATAPASSMARGGKP
jgi:hypothetical protein